METLPELLQASPAPALLAPGYAPMTKDDLRQFVAEAAAQLRSSGICPGDRVALVVENGPAAATAFLAASSVAACAPLNPAYQAQELDFYLADLRPRALLVSSGLDTPVREVAANRGIPVMELEADRAGGAGLFAIRGQVGPATRTDEPPAPDEVALLLHTSGTTSRPKLVPLTHRNLTVSAGNVARTLGLTERDRCLNVMPLFHIHGIVAALLASLASGGCVACAPGFHQVRFFDWLEELEPTWYTAVPSMHAAIVARAHEHAAIVRRHRLRFVRSSSAALPSSVEAELAQTFGVPVVEAYGMTEAAHQIASNDLSGERKLRSVGRAAGPEICIIGRDGERLPPGEVGEIAIRGPSVFPDYADNPEANAAAFTNGWFRTGDEGAVDEEGFLTLQGRTKEIINRGGEKVSPFEVDEALLRHAEVRQAVAFALPHDRLGEEVAAAVVLAPGLSADARELQDYVAEQLAPFKVPRRIVVVGELPTGATGKLQRIGLAERLGVEPVAQTAPPAAGTALEKELVAIWQAVLHRRDVAPGDDFFALGGDSILATEAVGHIRELIGDPDLRLVTIVRAPSPAAMALEIEAPSWVAGHGTIALSGEGDRDGKPLFLVHRGDGEILPFATLASRLGSIPTYGLRARGIDDGEEPAISIAEMASEYLGHVRRVQPRGPYRLGGFCLGGAIALEMAAQSLAGGEEVEGLILVDPRFRRPSGLALNLWLARRRLTERRFGRALVNRLAGKPRPGLDLDEDGREIERLLAQLREAHMPRAVELPATVILSADFERFQVPLWHLRRLVGAGSTWTRLPAAHSQLFRAPHVDAVAETVRAAVAT